MKENKSKISFSIIILILITILSFVFDTKIFGESSVFNKSISSNSIIDLIYHKIPCLIQSVKIVTIAWVLNKIIVLILNSTIKNSKRGGTVATLLGSSIKYVIYI